MAFRSKIRGKEQIQDNTIDIGRLELNFLAGVDWNITNGAENATITGLANGVLDADAVNKGQMDAAIQAALDALAAAHIDPVHTITTTSITLSGAQTVNGYVVQDGDRVAVMHQTTATEDGIYDVSTSGAWTRSSDALVGVDLGAKVFGVDQGNEADTLWMISNSIGEGVVGTDDLVAVKVGAQTPAPPVEVYNEYPTITNGSPNVTIANTPNAGTLRVYLNGQRMAEGGTNDYTVAGTTITFVENLRTTPASQADIVVLDYQYG